MKFRNYSIIGLLLCFLPLILSSCQLKSDASHGYVEARLVYVASQTSGMLNQLFVSRGDFVQKDEKLFQLDVNPQISDLKQASAKLAQSEANLANLETGKRPTEIAAIEAQKAQITAQLNFTAKTVKRFQHLVNRKLLEQSSLDETVSKYKDLQAKIKEINENLRTAKLEARKDEIRAAKAAVQASRADLNKTRWILGQKVINSPISGRVFDTFYEKGEVISINRPVLALISIENLYAVFFVPETKLAQINIGQKVIISCDHCPAHLLATINYISPKAEFTPPVIYSEKTRSDLIFRVEAKFNLSDAKKLHFGQPISVKLSSNNN